MKLVDNLAGILKEEQAVIDIFKHHILDAINNNKKLDIDIAVGFFFFEGFKDIEELLKDLYNSGKLGKIRVLMGMETTPTTKEALLSLQRDVSLLTNEDVRFIKELYDNKKIEFRVYLDRRFHVKLYIFYKNDTIVEVWVGSANFTKGGLRENIELVAPTGVDEISRIVYKNFFEEIWKKSSDKLENLQIIDLIIRETVEKPFIYLDPKIFFAYLINKLDKYYLFEDVELEESQILEFQKISFFASLDILNRYGGCILANSVGTGKTVIAATIVKYFNSLGFKALIIVKPTTIEFWKNVLRRCGVDLSYNEIISIGMLQKEDFDLGKYAGRFGLIVVDEAHNYRVSKPKSNRRKNLENICIKNEDTKVLLITATPINLSPKDLIDLINIFSRGKYKTKMNEEGVTKKINELNKKIDNIDKEAVELIKEIQKTFVVRFDWHSISKLFSDDIKKISGGLMFEKPEIYQQEYTYPSYVKKYIFDRVVGFLKKLNYEYAKMWEGNYVEDKNLIFWYKWILYKRLESSLYAFKVSLKKMIKRNKLILNIINSGIINSEELRKQFGNERAKSIISCLEKMNDSQRTKSKRNIESDIKLCKMMLREFHKLKEKDIKNFDTKLQNLIEIIKENKREPMIIFSSYISTVKYLYEKLRKIDELKGKIDYIHGKTKKDKEKFVNDFESGKFDIIITTDVLSEAVNLPRAKIVVNYDLPYNPVRLIQRDGRAIRITYPKKVKVFNFIPSIEIDKELEIYKKLDMRVNNILTFIGLDFAIWAVEEDKIEKVNEENRRKIIELVREYKEKLSKDSPENLLKNIIPTLSKEDIILRKVIEKFLITKEFVKNVGNYKKPVYTVLKSENNKNFFYVCFQKNGRIEQIGELQLGGLTNFKQISTEDINQVYSLIDKHLLEDKEKAIRTEIEDRKIRQIVKLCKELKIDYEKLRVIEKIYTDREYRLIIEKLEELKKSAPWEIDIRKKEFIEFIESKLSHSPTSLEKTEEFKLVGFVKYVA